MTPEQSTDPAPDTPSGARTKTQDRILALVILAAAALFWRDSGNIASPEARMFPRLILGALALLTVLLFARTFKMPAARRSAPVIVDRRRCVLFIVAMMVYAASVAEIGFFTASAIYVPVAAYLTGLRRPRVNIAVTAAFLVATYLVFVTLFSRPLPPEILGRLL